MKPLKREQIPQVKRPTEEVDVPELGGSVTVVGMGYSDRAMFVQAVRRAGLESGGDEGMTLGAVLAMAPVALAPCVLAADGQPVYDSEGWQSFGVEHRGVIERLMAVLMRLSGWSEEEARKNS